MDAAIALVIMFGLLALVFAGIWRVFAKAGEPGWASLVPVYNAIVLLRIAGKPWYWLLLEMIPIVGIYFAIVTVVDLARNFGKGVGFALGLIFLGFIFLPILGFSDAEYLGPDGSGRPRKRRRRDAYYDEEDEYDEAPRRRVRPRDDYDERGDYEPDDYERDDRRDGRRAADDDEDAGPSRRRPPREEFEDDDRRPRRPAARRRDDDFDDVDDRQETPRQPSSRHVVAQPPAGARSGDAEGGKLIPCTGCHRKLRVTPATLGKRIQCPGCGAVLLAE